LAERRRIVAANAKKDSDGKKGRATERIHVWLTPEQIEWLKRDREGPSAAVRALISEAVAMENLAKSLRSRKKK
jgi:hypothetical protein